VCEIAVGSLARRAVTALTFYFGLSGGGFVAGGFLISGSALRQSTPTITPAAASAATPATAACPATGPAAAHRPAAAPRPAAARRHATLLFGLWHDRLHTWIRVWIRGCGRGRCPVDCTDTPPAAAWRSPFRTQWSVSCVAAPALPSARFCTDSRSELAPLYARSAERLVLPADCRPRAVRVPPRDGSIRAPAAARPPRESGAAPPACGWLLAIAIFVHRSTTSSIYSIA
jgi:hypothetical protein